MDNDSESGVFEWPESGGEAVFVHVVWVGKRRIGQLNVRRTVLFGESTVRPCRGVSNAAIENGHLASDLDGTTLYFRRSIGVTADDTGVYCFWCAEFSDEKLLCRRTSVEGCLDLTLHCVDLEGRACLVIN